MEKKTCLVVGRARVTVVEGGPAVARAGDARVADVAAPAGVVTVVDEDRLALVFLLQDCRYIRHSTRTYLILELQTSRTKG